MKALVCNHSGLGDLLQMTPSLRKLHEMGYTVDLMARSEALESHLLDECPYVDDIIIIPNPWSGNFNEIQSENVKLFNSLKDDYDWSGITDQLSWDFVESKSEMMARELKLDVIDHHPEVFIKDEYEGCEGNYLFIHWKVDNHQNHTWEGALEWAEKNLMYDTVYDTSEEGYEDDINKTFAILRDSSCQVICSSVFAHCADALGIEASVINYGNQDRKVLTETKPRNIRECDSFCERSNRIYTKWEK